MQSTPTGIYVLHINLMDLLDQAQAAQHRGGDVQAFVEWYATTDWYGGVKSELQSCIAIAWVRPEEGIIHAARVVVERASLIAGDSEAREQAVMARGRQAQELVAVAVRARGIEPRRGRLLAQGLRDDLERICTSHDLWTWEIGDRHDPTSWQMLAA
jgi:hypothetical protein